MHEHICHSSFTSLKLLRETICLPVYMTVLTQLALLTSLHDVLFFYWGKSDCGAQHWHRAKDEEESLASIASAKTTLLEVNKSVLAHQKDDGELNVVFSHVFHGFPPPTVPLGELAAPGSVYVLMKTWCQAVKCREGSNSCPFAPPHPRTSEPKLAHCWPLQWCWCCCCCCSRWWRQRHPPRPSSLLISLLTRSLLRALLPSAPVRNFWVL